jgi:hypothetical protein
VLDNLTFADSGTYTCVARNSLNTDTASGLLRVVGIKPLISSPAKLPDLLVGAEVSLSCALEAGWPAPLITWYKDNQIVDQGRVDIEEDNTLKIRSAEKGDSGLYVCKAENSEGGDSIATQLNIRSRSTIVSKAVEVEFVKDSEVTVDCEYQVDPALLGGLHIHWFKDGVNLEVTQAPELPPVIGESALQVEEEISPCTTYDPELEPRLYMLTNSSLRICSLNQSDIGEYYCTISTDLETSLTSQVSSVYILTNFPWWILLLALLLLLLVILLLCLCCYWRSRKRGKGYYGMDLEDGGTHNKSDIYYTTADAESIMNEMDDTNKEEGKTPIFTPKTIQQLEVSEGSVGSLLDDDFLDQGFDEDGSFRERYAE